MLRVQTSVTGAYSLELSQIRLARIVFQYSHRLATASARAQASSTRDALVQSSQPVVSFGHDPLGIDLSLEPGRESKLAGLTGNKLTDTCRFSASRPAEGADHLPASWSRKGRKRLLALESATGQDTPAPRVCKSAWKRQSSCPRWWTRHDQLGWHRRHPPHAELRNLHPRSLCAGGLIHIGVSTALTQLPDCRCFRVLHGLSSLDKANTARLPQSSTGASTRCQRTRFHPGHLHHFPLHNFY